VGGSTAQAATPVPAIGGDGVTLARYIARRFLVMFGIVLSIFVALMLLVDVVEQARRVVGTSFGFRQAAELAALNVPGGVYRILPLIVILSSIALFLALSRSSELVVIRAAGRSALRLLMVPVSVAVVLGVLAVTVFNPLVAATSKRYEERSAGFFRSEESVLSVSPEGLWLRQGGTEGQTVIRAARTSLDGMQMYDTSFVTFAADGQPLERVEADKAELIPGAWRLTGVKRWALTDANPERSARTDDVVVLPTDLTRESIRDSFGAPSNVAIWDLPAFIASLDRAGFSARQHRVWLQMELAQPLLLAGMVLMAAGFTLRHARFGNTGLMVLAAVLAGFGIFFLRNFAQVLGDNGQIPVLLAAWSPPVATILLSLGLLLHFEDG
jgi:lipopolysaccharide export system permease protein